MATAGRSTATVAEAAAAIGVEPARIAKSLALRLGGDVWLLVTSGDGRLDNAPRQGRVRREAAYA